MPFVPAGVPTPLPVAGPFAAVTIDAPRRRVFAAGARTLAMIDADTGKLLATIRIGTALSLAVEPLGGHVFAGMADGRIREVDPDRKIVVRSLAAGGPVELLLYDSPSGRLYAAAGGGVLATIDARSFVPAGSVPLPATPAGIAADPVTSEFYVGFSDRGEIAIVDPARGAVRTTFRTAGGSTSSAVRFDAALGEIVVAGTGGEVDVYDRAGTPEGSVAIPGITGPCELDPSDHRLACSGSGGLTFVQLERDGAPQLAGTVAEGRPAHAVLDEQTHDALVVSASADGSGATVERFETAPAAPHP